MLLLHGSPTSSHMFRNLIPYLADRYQAIAPDYPGYGQSDAPDRRTFAYSKARRGTRFQCSFRMVSIIQRLTKPISAPLAERAQIFEAIVARVPTTLSRYSDVSTYPMPPVHRLDI